MDIRRPTELRKKRDKHDARKKIIIASVGAVFLLSIIGMLFFVKQSKLFAVRSVEVSGIPPAYGEQVRRDLEDFSRVHSLRFRLLGAGNILAWDADLREFLAASPQFRFVRIEKEYTQRRIDIIVEEREKFGVWCRIGDRDVAEDVCYWFDKDGVLFAKAPRVQSELFNRVHDVTGRTLQLRDRILPDRLFGNLVSIFTLLERVRINTKTIVLRDLALEEVEVDSISDPTLYFSLQFSPEFATGAIDALRRSGAWERASYVNLRVENRAYYR